MTDHRKQLLEVTDIRLDCYSLKRSKRTFSRAEDTIMENGKLFGLSR